MIDRSALGLQKKAQKMHATVKAQNIMKWLVKVFQQNVLSILFYNKMDVKMKFIVISCPLLRGMMHQSLQKHLKTWTQV